MWQWLYNIGMVYCKYFLKSGKNCYLSSFGDIKLKEEKMFQIQQHLGTENHGELAKQASEYKARCEYGCTTDENFCPWSEKYINIWMDLLQHIQTSQSYKFSLHSTWVTRGQFLSLPAWTSSFAEYIFQYSFTLKDASITEKTGNYLQNIVLIITCYITRVFYTLYQSLCPHPASGRHKNILKPQWRVTSKKNSNKIFRGICAKFKKKKQKFWKCEQWQQKLKCKSKLFNWSLTYFVFDLLCKCISSLIVEGFLIMIRK